MFAEIEIVVAPNQCGNLPVFRVFNGEGKDLGLYEAYDAAEAVAFAAFS